VGPDAGAGLSLEPKEGMGESARKTATGELAKPAVASNGPVAKSATVRTKQKDEPKNKGNPGKVKNKGREGEIPVSVEKLKVRGQISELEKMLGHKLDIYMEADVKKSLKEDSGQWVRQHGSDYDAFAYLVGPQKGGGHKAVIFTSYNGSPAGKAKIGSTKNWYPAPVPVDPNEIPPKIHAKIMQRAQAMGVMTEGRLNEDELAQDPVDAYWQTALWASNDNSDESGGEPLDRNYGPENIDPKSLQQGSADVQKFIQYAEKAGLLTDPQAESLAHVAHDFWLTRNGHGAGFWDGDYPEKGDALTELAKKFGEVDLYVGDDGVLYLFDEGQGANLQLEDEGEESDLGYDEDDPFHLESEMEDGIVIGDARGGGYSLGIMNKHAGDFSSVDEALAAAKSWMDKEGYWPNIFFVNDHGNVTLVDHEGKEVRSWV
jgi:hypothetical protein